MATATVTYEPTPGQDIRKVSRETADIANRRQAVVFFTFNGVDVVVSPGDEPSAIYGRWRAEVEREAEEYRNSAEGKAAAAEAEATCIRMQRETDKLLADLPAIINDLAAVVRWCAKLSMAADHVGVTWEPRQVAEALIAAGWRANAHVGRQPEVIEADRQMMGEYIVGQAIACMRKGMPPHPMTEVFARSAGFVR